MSVRSQKKRGAKPAVAPAPERSFCSMKEPDPSGSPKAPHLIPVAEPLPAGADALDAFTAQDLAAELRARGYEVTARKITVIEL